MSSTFRDIFPNLDSSSREHFRHWQEAVEAIFLDPQSYREGSSVLQPSGGRKNNAGRIFFSKYDPNNGVVFNWARMERAIFSNAPSRGLYPKTQEGKRKYLADRKKWAIKINDALEQARKEEEQERAKKWAITQSVVSTIYKLTHGLKPVISREDHPYLQAKHMPIPDSDGGAGSVCLSVIDKRTLCDVFDKCGLKNDNGKPFRFGSSFGNSLLMAPLSNFLPHSNSLAVHSLQFIDERGQKCFLKGGITKGCFWMAKEISLIDAPIIAVGEGIATSYTFSMHFGVPAVSAMNCGNLGTVAKTIADHYHPDKIIILSDVGNGEEKAVEACKLVNGELVKPQFTLDLIKRFKELRGPEKAPTDWNDWLIAKGLI